MEDPNWWALGFILGAIAWQGLGICLASWRQPTDETFLISMILWASAPFWIWFVPFSQTLRQFVTGFWVGMD